MKGSAAPPPCATYRYCRDKRPFPSGASSGHQTRALLCRELVQTPTASSVKPARLLKLLKQITIPRFYTWQLEKGRVACLEVLQSVDHIPFAIARPRRFAQISMSRGHSRLQLSARNVVGHHPGTNTIDGHGIGSSLNMILICCRYRPSRSVTPVVVLTVPFFEGSFFKCADKVPVATATAPALLLAASPSASPAGLVNETNSIRRWRVVCGTWL